MELSGKGTGPDMTDHTQYFDSRSPKAARKMSTTLSSYLKKQTPAPSGLVLLCIGTDRVAGDSLGPLIGYKLSKQHIANIYVYGTLQHPVHALNLEKVQKEIKKRHPHLPVVAVDASLGDRSDLEYITVSPGAIYPGAGVDKSLGAVGDISITGVVNTASSHPQAVLQVTRLHTVMQLADVICEGIAQTAAALAPV